MPKTTIENAVAASFQRMPAPEAHANARPEQRSSSARARMLRCAPSKGNSKNPPAIAPSTPPKVFALYTRPTLRPAWVSAALYARKIKGNRNPNRKVMGNRVRKERTKVPCVTPAHSARTLRLISMNRSGSAAVQPSCITMHRARSISAAAMARSFPRNRSATSAEQALPAAIPHKNAVSMVV